MSIDSFALLPNFTDDIFADRFNQIDKMFSTLTGTKPLSDTPPYNIIQTDSNRYQLIVSVPGFTENEIEILVQNNQLKISAKKHSNVRLDKNSKVLHQGIFNRDFSLSFNLNQRIKVGQASLSAGLLKLVFEYQTPDEEKAKKIAITVHQPK